MTSRVILIVDDDRAFRAVYGTLLSQAGYQVVQAVDRPSARAALSQQSYPVVVLDLMLPPDGTVEAGLTALSELLALQPATKVIVVSGAGDVQVLLKAVHAGAHDFLVKPVDPDVLLTVVQRAVARADLEDQLLKLRASLAQAQPQGGMLGSSPAFLEALRMTERVAESDLPVLITGESGTGKELMARTVHDRSKRRGRPFVAINCGALPDSLLESTLFGHTRGSFTGASRDRKGLFAEANGGTVFLDEIGEMPPHLQVELLRTLESGDILPVGEDRPARVDVRFVSATNQDLVAMVREGTFREDLYWRIRGAQVHLPSLRDRAVDVPLLARHFLNQAASLSPDGRPKGLSPAAEDALLSHDWPGNLRELRHEMQRATVLAAMRGSILPEDLGFVAERGQGTNRSVPTTLKDRIESFEKREIEAALARFGGNKTRAAEALGLSRQGLLSKLARYRDAT